MMHPAWFAHRAPTARVMVVDAAIVDREIVRARKGNAADAVVEMRAADSVACVQHAVVNTQNAHNQRQNR